MREAQDSHLPLQSTLLTKDSASIKFGVESATAPISNQQNGNILWGAAATALLGATLADWQKKREEEARRIAELEARKADNAGRPNIKAIRQAQKDQDAAVRARWAAQGSSQSTTNAAMERKMARIDKAEDAKWTASQIAIQKQKDEERERQNDVTAARWAGIASVAKENEKNNPWWEATWENIKTFGQEKIIEPIKNIWNQYILEPIIQPVAYWWKATVPLWIKEAGLSLIPIVGDGWGLVRQVINYFTNKPVDGLDVTLSLAGLFFDIPWPQEGVIGGDVTIAVLKGLSAVIPPGPARDIMTQLIKDGLKNPDDLARIVETSQALMKNEQLLKALIDNSQALESVMRYGPEAVEVLARFPSDESVAFLQKYGDDGLQRMLKYKDMPLGLVDEAFPLGFRNVDEFETFGDTIRKDLSEGGYQDVELYITGSSVSGMSYPKPGKPSFPFDSIERGTSDYDIGIVSDELWQKAAELGLKVKNNPTMIGPLDLKSESGKKILEELGLLDVVKNMDTEAGRDTGFMIYQSAEDFLNYRGPAIAFPDN